MHKTDSVIPFNGIPLHLYRTANKGKLMANLCANLAEKWCPVWPNSDVHVAVHIFFFFDVFNIYSQVDFNKAVSLHEPNELEMARGKTLGNKPHWQLPQPPNFRSLLQEEECYFTSHDTSVASVSSLLTALWVSDF